LLCYVNVDEIVVSHHYANHGNRDYEV